MAYENFYATTLEVQASASDTTLQVKKIPNTATNGWLVLEGRNSTNREIVRFTGVSGNILTGVIRGQQGTLGVAHASGTSVEMNPTAQDFTDALNTPNDVILRFDENLSDFIVANTGTLATVSGLNGSFSDIIFYINGYRYTKNSIPNKVYTANKDTYVFININGVVTYTEVANNATTPATPANNILVGKVVTGATITSIALTNRGSVRAENIDFGGNGSGIWWEEIGRATALANVTTLSVPSIANRKYLKVIFNIIPTASMSGANLTFNADTGSNYGYRTSSNGGADATGTFGGLIIDTGSAPGTPAIMFGSVEGVNVNGYEKPFIGHSIDTFATGASNFPRRRELQGKWASSNVISRVDLNMTVAAAIGTEIIILGHN